MVAVSFISGGNRENHKLLQVTDKLYHIMLYQVTDKLYHIMLYQVTDKLYHIMLYQVTDKLYHIMLYQVTDKLYHIMLYQVQHRRQLAKLIMMYRITYHLIEIPSITYLIPSRSGTRGHNIR
jgi:hypothetical protein